MKQELKWTLEVEKNDQLFVFSMPAQSTKVGLGSAYEVLYEMISVVKNELDSRDKKLQESKKEESKEEGE